MSPLAYLDPTPGLEIGKQPVRPANVVLGLGILAVNVFLQSRPALSKVLNIDSATYRLLRLLPIVAVADAACCLMMICLCQLQPNQYLPERILPTIGNDAIGKHQTEKLIYEKGTVLAWRQKMMPNRRAAKYILALVAGLQLVKLTRCHGVPFSVFCAWALYTTYLANELLRYIAPNGFTEEAEQLPSNSSTPKMSSQIISIATLKLWFQAFIFLAILVEFMHISWLSQFYVPRTLWMDWGPPQISVTNPNVTMHFDAPPGMPGPVTLPGTEAGELVYGFWPSHTSSGVLVAILNWLVFTLTMTFYSMVLLAFPFMTFWYLCVAAIILLAIGVYYGADNVSNKAITNIIIPRTIFFVKSLRERVRRRSRLMQQCVTVATYIAQGLGIILLALAFVLLMCGPFWIVSSILYPIWEPIWNLFMLDDFCFAMLDRPDGSYACLTGMLIGGSTIVFRRLITPMMTQRSHNSTKLELMRYWTAAWTVFLLCLTSLGYYGLVFDGKDTHQPLWRFLPFM